MSPAVVPGDDLNVLVALATVTVLVLDPRVREMDAPVEVGQLVFSSPRPHFMLVSVRPAVAVRTATVPLLQEPLILSLQLVVQDNASNAAAAAPQAPLGAKVGAVDLRVVGQLARSPETRVEALARLAAAVDPVGFEQLASRLGRSEERRVGKECRL